MAPSSDLAPKVVDAIGAEGVVGDPGKLAAFGLQGSTPRVAAYPRTIAQVSDLLKLASRERWGVIPWGGGHGISLGDKPRRYDLALMTSRLNRVVDQDPENLTLSAEAGLGLEEANIGLRPHRLILPLGFGGERNSLGGIIAANRPVPQRLLYGDARDLLIGLQVVLPDGRLVRYGRKVIKNVAGYDMNKLFLGSQGMLGVIVEATFKLFALPDDQRFLLVAFPDLSAASRAAAVLLGSSLLPSCLFLLEPGAGRAFFEGLGKVPHDGPCLVAGFEGRTATLRRQVESGHSLMMREGASACDPLANLPGSATTFLQRPRAGGAESGSLRIRISVAPSRVGTVLARVRNSLDEMNLQGVAVADFGSGSVLLTIAGEGADPHRLENWIATLRAEFLPERGLVVPEALPDSLLGRIPVWEGPAGEKEIMASIKARFDPNDILAPGRFL